MAAKKRTTPGSVLSSFKNLDRYFKPGRQEPRHGGSSAGSERHLLDAEVFTHAMRDVREIKEFRRLRVYQKRPDILSPQPDPDTRSLSILREIVEGKRKIDLSDTQEYVQWVNRDYHCRITHELHRGFYSVRDSIDLHGKSVEEAESEICQFLRDSRKRNYRCVKIIHGRGLRSTGGPVLKQAVMNWLSKRYRKHVIAFVTARPCDGGLGALYVLLK